MPRDDCPLHPLAGSAHVQIHVCGHGTVHFTVGQVTLRVPGEWLDERAETLAFAAARHGARAPGRLRALC